MIFMQACVENNKCAEKLKDGRTKPVKPLVNKKITKSCEIERESGGGGGMRKGLRKFGFDKYGCVKVSQNRRQKQMRRRGVVVLLYRL